MKYKSRLLITLLSFFFLIDSIGQVNDSLNHYKSVAERSVSTDQLLEAYLYFNNSKKKNEQINNKVGVAYDLDYVSLIERKVGQFYESENTGVIALELLDSLPNNDYNLYLRKRILNRLGIIRRNLKDYDKALFYYKNLLNLEMTSSNTATLYNNIGITYKYKGQLDSAQFYLDKAYLLDKEKGVRSLNYARTLDNLGYVQAMRNIKEGVGNMMQALQIRDSLNNSMFTSYIHLADINEKQKNKEKALYYFDKAYKEAKRNKSENGMLKVLPNLLKLNQSKFLEEFLKMNEDKRLERQLNENKFAKVKYDLAKSEKELVLKTTQFIEEKAARLSSEKKSQRNLFIMFALILVSSFIIYLLSQRHKKQLLIKQFETENRISKKLHDEVANDVFHLMTKYQSDSQIDDYFIDELDNVYQKVRDISKANTDADVGNSYNLILSDLLNSFNGLGTHIIAKDLSKIPWDELSLIKRKVLYRVVQELLINMRKHSKATLVTFNFQKDQKKVIVEYQDNGVGCDLIKSNGLINTESRMEMIGGQITFDSKIDNGFKATLIL